MWFRTLWVVSSRSASAYQNHMVRLEWEDGLPRIVIHDRKTGEEHSIAFAEEAYSLGFQGAAEYDTNTIRFVYSSMTTLSQTYDYDMATRERTLPKTQEVPSGAQSGRTMSHGVSWRPATTAKWFRFRWFITRPRSLMALRLMFALRLWRLRNFHSCGGSTPIAQTSYRGPRFLFTLLPLTVGKERGFAGMMWQARA